MRRPEPRVLLALTTIAVAVAVVAAVLLLTGGDNQEPATPAPKGRADPFFGVNDPLLYSSAQFGKDDLSRDHAAAMAAAGIAWVRFSTAWRGEEPTAPFEGVPHFDFQFLDAAMTVLAEEELAAGLTLTTTPVWAAESENPEGCSANISPRAPAVPDFAEYAGTVAERYGPDGAFWEENPDLPQTPIRSLEIWNEPNWNAFWCPEPNPELYADLFVAAAKAIRDANPDVRIVTGGLTSIFDSGDQAVTGGMDATTFIQRAVARRPEIASLADAVGFHVYATDVAGVNDAIARFRGGLDENGLKDLPIEINEAGWPTVGTAFPHPEEERATLIGDLAHALWSSPCNVDALALYAWRTLEANPAASADFYGIADPDSAELYESGRAYSDRITSESGEPTPQGDC